LFIGAILIFNADRQMAKTRIKILHVVLSLEPGGMENGLVNVASRLNRDEFEVHVCCLERGGDFIQRLPDPGNVSILEKPPGFSFRTVVELAKVISRIKPNLVHSHNLGPLIYSGLATGVGLSRPILQGEHGLPEPQRQPKHLRQRRFFYRGCRRVQTVSRGLREDLIRLGMPASKIIVIQNGVDTQRFVPANSQKAREEIGLPAEGPVLGIVGRFDVLKRHTELIDAFVRLPKSSCNAQLLIVGDGGSEFERVKERVRLSPANDRIHMIGFKSEPRPYYQSMDLLVVPSLLEGMSNVVLEAMACGVPVLGHNACGNAEIIRNGHDGLIDDLSTTEALNVHLTKALSNRAHLLEMGSAARQKVLERFSMRNMVENYEAVYRELAGGVKCVVSKRKS
jgi:glycosyltransferase involved in cell wall biosynthesis